MARRRTPARAWPKFGQGVIDESWVHRLIECTRAQSPTSVDSMLVLLRLVRENVVELPPELMDECRSALLAFDFSRSDDASIAKGAWRESNQLCFAVAEYLAGIFLPADQFEADGMFGQEKAEHARERILTWLAWRFRYGHSDWLDPVAMQFESAALSLVLDYSPDKELKKRAELVLDLVMLDGALHQFNGHLIASSGRAKGSAVREPDRSGFDHWWSCGVLGEKASDCPVDQARCLFCARSRYEVPKAVLEIATGFPYRRVRTSQGLELHEVSRQLARIGDDSPEKLKQFLLGMDVWPYEGRQEPSAFGRLKATPSRLFGKLPGRVMKPIDSVRNTREIGTALQRANVQTFLTRSYSLSSVQRYHPGEFGGQQLIWQAQLPGGVVVFGNHPGDNLRDSSSLAPLDRWALHGILPDVAQHDNVLLAISDLRTRKGYQEGKRAEYVQFHFPSVKFDETRIGPRWVVGRSGRAYIAIIGTQTLELVSESEVVQRGLVTGYAVVMADDEEVTSMGAFVRLIKDYSLTMRGDRLELVSPFGQYSLTWGRDFLVGGQKIPTEYPRYDTHWVQAPRNPSRLEIHGRKNALELDWLNATRSTHEI